MGTVQEIHGNEQIALQLIEEALSLDVSEQIDFLIRACGEDMALREHSLSLLKHELDDDDFLEFVYGSDSETENAFDLVGKIVGNYCILEKIGQGGAADVFLAYRNDDIHHQPVALKIIRGWGDTNELVKRIKKECKILSQFQHPNIVKFIDAGNAVDGRPYFVLEYVKGLPILEYCKQNNLSLNERLQLFLDVCDAVHAAHSQLTLHRDLKPSNIIVTDSGVAKLLDFGIAKIYQDEDKEHADITRFFSPMTPQYASPEQIKQMPLSMSSDQYSLGVVLYELLTGQLPYNTEGKEERNSSGLPLEPNVKKPSDTLRNIGAQHRANQVKGDLDTIIMKAIQFDVKNRYSSVYEFAEDIRRYMRFEPITAKNISYHYLARRFVSRKITAVLLVAGFNFIFVSIVIAQQLRILHERDTAIAERQKYEQAQELRENLFEQVNPESSSQKSVFELKPPLC